MFLFIDSLKSNHSDDEGSNSPEDLNKTACAVSICLQDMTTVNLTPIRNESYKIITKKSITPHRIVCPSPDDQGNVEEDFAKPINPDSANTLR